MPNDQAPHSTITPTTPANVFPKSSSSVSSILFEAYPDRRWQKRSRMDKIGFLIWVEESADTEFAKKACALVENEINASGGIAGKDIFLQLEISPDDIFAAQDQFFEKIEQAPDLLFGAHPAVPGWEGLEKLKAHGSDVHVLFTRYDLAWGITEPIHPNIFNISRYGIPNNEIMPALLDPLDAGSIIFFHMKISDPESYREKLPGEFQSKFTPIGFEFTEAEDPSKLDAKINPVLSKLKKNDVLFLNTTAPITTKIFQHLNENGLHQQVVSFFLGDALHEMAEINFPLMGVQHAGNEIYLGMEAVFDKIGMAIQEKAECQIWFEQLEIVYLVQYVAQKGSIVFSSTEQFIGDVIDSINSIDGVNDIFIGKSVVYAFQGGNNSVTQNFLYQYPKSLQAGGTMTPLLYPKQIIPTDGSWQFVDVNYVYVDILRINHINIGDATWSCEFNLDIISPHPDPIDIVKFNNLSAINPKFDHKLISEKKTGKIGEKTYRYFVVANFDFEAIADNYPFDAQHIFISYSITDEHRFGMIQPTPEMLLDREFEIEGWVFDDAKSGVIRRKSTFNEGSDLHKTVDVREEIRLGWTLKRTNSIMMLKVLIPLFFLIFLVYYTIFIEIKEINTSVGILTTSFLAAIALYFSTERPQPLRMTIIDLIFAGFYCIAGITIVLTSLTLLGDNVHHWIMNGLKIAIPLSIAGFVAYLVRRVKSVQLWPKID
jgi:hypothetical protein